MDAAATGTKIYVLRQEAQRDPDFNTKYKSVVDHLIEAIQKDGRLDEAGIELEIVSTNQKQFQDRLIDITDEHPSDRPLAFLFVKPSPEGQSETADTLFDLAEIADASTVTSALASSTLLINNEGKERSNEFKDQMELYRSIEGGDPFADIEDNIDKFSNFFVARPKVNDAMDDYATAFVDQVLAMHQANEPSSGSDSNTVELKANQTIGVLDFETQQEPIIMEEWEDRLRQDPTNIKIQVMARLAEDASLDNIAAQFEISLNQVNAILNAFLADPHDFFLS